MALSELQRNLDRWGIDLTKWPQPEQQQANLLLQRSPEAAVILKQNQAMFRLLEENFPVADLDLPQFRLSLLEQLEPQPQKSNNPAHAEHATSWSQPGGYQKTNGPSRLESWLTGFFRPAFSAALLVAIGFYFGFSDPALIQPFVNSLYNGEEQQFDTVSQIVFDDSSTNYYLSYSQAFLETDLSDQDREQVQP